MIQDAILRDLLAVLDRTGVPYMLTGSYASNIYGRVRSTFDADIVVALRGSQLGPLVRSLGGDFYIDATTFDEVRKAGGQFNAIHRPSGLKVDFYLPRNDHDREALRRRRSFSLWGAAVWVITAEDLILAKLVWSKEGGSARQIEDAQGVYDVQKACLDIEYLKSRADELSVRESLNLILK